MQDDIIEEEKDLDDEDLAKTPIIDPLADDDADLLDPDIVSADALAEEEDEEELDLDDDES